VPHGRADEPIEKRARREPGCEHQIRRVRRIASKASSGPARVLDRPGTSPRELRAEPLDALERSAAPGLIWLLASWLPPGALLDRLIRRARAARPEIGAKDGVTPGAWSWRFAHELCDELESTRPLQARRAAGA